MRLVNSKMLRSAYLEMTKPIICRTHITISCWISIRSSIHALFDAMSFVIFHVYLNRVFVHWWWHTLKSTTFTYPPTNKGLHLYHDSITTPSTLLFAIEGGNILIRTCYYDWEITGFIFRQPTNPPLYSLELTYCPLRQHFLPIVMPHILLRVPLVHYIHLIILEASFARLLSPLAIKNGYICRSESLKVLCGIWNEYICRSGSLKVLCGI